MRALTHYRPSRQFFTPSFERFFDDFLGSVASGSVDRSGGVARSEGDEDAAVCVGPDAMRQVELTLPGAGAAP